jgi:hypothetical protein
MKCAMTGQEKGDLLIEVNAWTGSTVFIAKNTPTCSFVSRTVYRK